MSEAILSLGSNLGNRLKNLETAIEAISNLPETKIEKISDYYETVPFGVLEKQNDYINCCIKISTDFSPQILLGSCLGIESAMGRVRKHRFCARTIDIDLLMFENETVNEKNLILPHPRLKERAFVLVPLSDISENMQFKGMNLKKEFNACDKSSVKKLK